MIYATGGFAITPSDSANLPGATTAGIVATAAGTITATLLNGSTVTFQIAAGIMMPIIATKVFSTGTSASGLVGLVR